MESCPASLSERFTFRLDRSQDQIIKESIKETGSPAGSTHLQPTWMGHTSSALAIGCPL